MAKIYSHTVRLDADIIDAFCVLQKGFTDQFVYYDKQQVNRYMGLGRCIAVPSLESADVVLQGEPDREPIFFSFNRFDEANPKPVDDMMAAFPKVRLMVPEVVLMQVPEGAFLQVNSLGPVYLGRVERFVRHAREAKTRTHRSIVYALTCDSYEDWQQVMALGSSRIESQRIHKLVPSRRVFLQAQEPFSSKDVLINLIDGDAQGTVFMYRYGDVFFCGCTPELLVRKQGDHVESMCLAGTISCGTNEEERAQLADALLNDDKNRREHEYVVQFMREVFGRNCHNVSIPQAPDIAVLRHVQHLCTPVSAQVMEGRSLLSLASQLHPTPALSGTPVGEAMMALREAESYNRGFFGGAVGYVDGAGSGEFSVAIRSGVFDGESAWLYAGCGIVEGSDPRSEFDEIDLKLKTILSAMEAPRAAEA
ncbi:MAG: isochorismate synthase [Eggerthellaceae bacterium]